MVAIEFDKRAALDRSQGRALILSDFLSIWEQTERNDASGVAGTTRRCNHQLLPCYQSEVDQHREREREWEQERERKKQRARKSLESVTCTGAQAHILYVCDDVGLRKYIVSFISPVAFVKCFFARTACSFPDAPSATPTKVLINCFRATEWVIVFSCGIRPFACHTVRVSGRFP